MNAVNLPVATVAVKPNISVIAIDAQDEINQRACGRITMWSLGGDVTVGALTEALKRAGSAALPPDEPSALVALHRAVEGVAKTLGHLDVHHLGRGEWAIVGSASERQAESADASVQRQLVYSIECTAKVVREGDSERLEIQGRGEEQIRAAYNAAKTCLAPSDIGTWLTEKAAKLDAVALRDRGGVYFVPKPTVHKWEHIIAALKACSRHAVHVIPAMRSADAVEAILAAVTDDTRTACGRIVADIGDGTLGTKALGNREKVTAELLDRVERYEELLGARLDALRSVLDETRAAVATAKLAAG